MNTNSSPRGHCHLRRLWSALAGAAAVLTVTLGMGLPADAAETNAKDKPNSCVNCHSDSRFLVQNKKLYDYFQGWELSAHAANDVTCVNCHGGNPKAEDKKSAHGDGVGSASSSSPTNYRNIPDTCAKCHKEIAERYKESEHSKHLVATKTSDQGPSCVTCHGSVNTTVLTVNTVRNTCQQCHNEETRNNPEIPGEAEDVLNNFLSINRYYRAIASRSTPDQAKAFFQIVDPLIQRLAADWHTFDLEEIGDRTHDLVEFMKVRRNEMKKKPTKRRN